MNPVFYKKYQWFLTISVVAIILSACASVTEETPVLRNGTLDLSTWDFSKNPEIDLQGESLFYWKQWPIDENGMPDTSLLRQADTISASKFVWTDKIAEHRGFGTFRFYIKRTQLTEKLILNIPRSLAATEVYINGKFIKKHGVISKEANGEKIDGRPLHIELPQENKLDLIFLISNHKHRLGGGFSMVNSIQQADFYTKKQKQMLLIEGITTFLILLFGIYQIIHFLSFRTYSYFLYLGLFCLVGASRQLFVGEGLIYTFFPDISFDMVQKMRYVGYYGGLASVFMYHAVLFPGYFHSYLQRIIVFISLAGIVFVLIAPTFYGTFTAPMFQVLGLVIVSLGFYQIIKAMRDKRPYAVGMFVSMTITGAIFINDILRAMQILQTDYYVNYGLLFYVGFQIVLNNRIQRQTEQKLIQLAFDIEDMSKNIQHKQEEIVKLRSETFQQLKSKEKLVENLKKVASNDASVSIQHLIVHLKSELLEDSQLNRIKNDIEVVNHEFAERLRQIHPNLTKTDIEICSYLRLSLGRKEIAKLRFTTVDAVKKSRNRLRKKMNLSATQDLETYIKSI